MIDNGKIWENCERIERVAESETPMETHQGAIREITSRDSQDRRQDLMVYHTKSLKCPKILEHLWKPLKVVWKKRKMSLYWR